MCVVQDKILCIEVATGAADQTIAGRMCSLNWWQNGAVVEYKANNHSFTSIVRLSFQNSLQEVC